MYFKLLHYISVNRYTARSDTVNSGLVQRRTKNLFPVREGVFFLSTFLFISFPCLSFFPTLFRFLSFCREAPPFNAVRVLGSGIQGRALAAFFGVLRGQGTRLAYRDVTKFELEFDDVRTSNVFTRFEIRRMFEALCCLMRCGKIFVLRLISYAQTASERRQTSFFSISTCHTNYSNI